MSDYSCLSILKTRAKKLVRIQRIKLSEALEIVARDAKFSSYHELTEVAKRDPVEQRLVLAAMGENTPEEVIYRDEVFYAIDREVEDMLSGDIAETNAYGFSIENLEATKLNYDSKRGILTVQAIFDYQGEQDPERALSASSFEIVAKMELLLREDEWSLVEDSLELTSVTSNVNDDWYDLDM
ncbi:hypothetical protein [Dickeya zeae]|uniref:hypothetical protein n=1 Tax=Dickeya zeae TaxID=204042 RepID=UPI001F16A157|nr:hypothetical protein [Dickeya zeae]UJR62401.1 hypothetical protein HJ586_09390 [Dickeya zeae]